MGWDPGSHVVRREVWNGKVWMASDAIVVRDSPSLLVLFTPTGAPMGYPAADWPTADGRHPWHDKPRWEGHGVLQLLWPSADHSVWVFWDGSSRAFSCWYVNLQAPFVRTPLGIDTLDHEVDVVVGSDGSVALKDVEAVAECVSYGRFSAAFGQSVVVRGESLADRLRAEGIWWDSSWAGWTPPRDWEPLSDLPLGWSAAPDSPSAPRLSTMTSTDGR